MTLRALVKSRGLAHLAPLGEGAGARAARRPVPTPGTRSRKSFQPRKRWEPGFPTPVAQAGRSGRSLSGRCRFWGH